MYETKTYSFERLKKILSILGYSINKKILIEIIIFTFISLTIASFVSSFNTFDDFIQFVNYHTFSNFDRDLITLAITIVLFGTFLYYKSGELQFQNLQHRKIEIEVQESENKFRSIFNEVSDSIFLVPMNGPFFEVNKTACKKFGYTRREFLQMTLLDLGLSKENHIKLTKMIILKGSVMFEMNAYRKNRSTIPVEIHAKMIEYEGRAALLAIVRDISERKNSEEVLSRAKIEAEAANRSKSEFLANMSHELRTPLNSVIGFSEILNEQSFGKLNEKQLKYIKNISTSGKHLLELINQILDLSKVEAGKMELDPDIFNIFDAMEEVRTLLTPLAMKKNIALELVFDEQIEDIDADIIKFKQILYNLLSNAIKFTHEDGKVTINANKENDLLKIEVIDTGIGISKEDIDKLFKPFVQLDQFKSKIEAGTGLGLALVKRFVEMQRGDIKVESEINKGSTFSFTIPFTNSKTE